MDINDINGDGKYNVNDFLDMKNEDILKENGGKKFSICIQNPPFDKDLHLDFFNKSLDLCNKVVIIEPGQWLVQLKENGKYTKENSKSVNLKNKIENHVKSIELQNFNKEFNIANKTVCSIVTVDYSKNYNKIDFNCCGDKSQVDSIYDCNLIGNYTIVKSILNKCKSYKDHMIDHCINIKKYKEYEDKGYWFLRYGNYMLNNLGSGKKIEPNTTARTTYYNNGNRVLFSSYLAPAFDTNASEILNHIPFSKSGNPCDSLYGTKEEIENWKYFSEHNNIVVFVNICLTIDENNNSREYLPWIVDKKYTDKEIYNILNINKEEQTFIENIITKFERYSDWFRRYISGK